MRKLILWIAVHFDWHRCKRKVNLVGVELIDFNRNLKKSIEANHNDFKLLST